MIKVSRYRNSKLDYLVNYRYHRKYQPQYYNYHYQISHHNYRN